LEATAIEASKWDANVTESAANAEQKRKEEAARTLVMHQAEEERIRRQVQKMGEEETGKVAKLEEAVLALKKQVVGENSKGLKLEEEVRVLKKAVDEEKNKAVTLEEAVAALKKAVEEEKRKAAKLEEEVATLRKTLDEANAMVEKEKGGAKAEGEVVAALKKAVEEGKIKAVTLAQEVAALRKTLDEANAMVEKEKERAGGEREMLAALKNAVEEEKGKTAKFEEEVAALKKAEEADSTENTRKDNQNQERASAVAILTEQNGTEGKTRAPTKKQSTGTEGRQVPDEHDLAFRYPFQVWHNGVRVRVAMCVPGAELWCDRAQYKVRGLPASLEHSLLFQLPCRLSAPVNFTLGSPAEVVLFFVAAPRDGELPHKLVSEGWTLQSIFSRFDWDGPGTDKEQDRFVTTAAKTYAGPVSYTLPAHAGETVMGLCIRPLDHSTVLEKRSVEVNTASMAPPRDSNASAVRRLQSDAATEKMEHSVASLSVEHGKSELGTNHCAVCEAMATVASIEKTARDRTKEEGQVHAGGGGTETKMRWTERLGIGFEPGVGSTSEQFERCLTMAVEVEVRAELESLRAQIAHLKSALGVGESDLMATLEAIQAENARLRQETVHLREALSVREREHKTALKSIRCTASCVDMSTRNRACLMRFRTRLCCVSALMYVRLCAETRTMMPQRPSGKHTGVKWKSCSARWKRGSSAWKSASDSA
jgi:regulator of replication initiation timing